MRGPVDDDEGAAERRALFWPPTKIAGRYLSPYLAGRDDAEAARPDAGAGRARGRARPRTRPARGRGRAAHVALTPAAGAAPRTSGRREIGGWGAPMSQGRRRWVAACAAAAAVAAVGVVPGLAGAQGPGSACAGPLALANGSFEDPASVDAFAILAPGKVPGWTTTEPDGRIEVWQSGYRGVPAAAGEQFAELAANEPGELRRGGRPERRGRESDPGAGAGRAGRGESV